MKFKKNVIIVSVFLMAGSAFAGLNSELRQSSQDGSVEIKDVCSEINLKDEDPGIVCKAGRGGLFQRVEINGEFGIADITKNSIEVQDGKIWFDAIAIDVNHDEATKICNSKPGQSLPKIEELKLATSRGIREAFSGDMGEKYFWSSSIDGNVASFIYLGSPEYVDDHDLDMVNSARCVNAAR